MGFLQSRGRPTVQCFFCLSKAMLGSHPGVYPNAKGTKENWLCPACECWNVRDKRGEMVSNFPAMRDRGMNKASWEKRGEYTCSLAVPKPDVLQLTREG